MSRRSLYVAYLMHVPDHGLNVEVALPGRDFGCEVVKELVPDRLAGSSPCQIVRVRCGGSQRSQCRLTRRGLN